MPDRDRTRTQLAQVAPNGTSAVSIWSPPYRDQWVIENIIVCNTTASGVVYNIYLDVDGTTYSAATALVKGLTIAANTTTIYEVNLYMMETTGNLAVEIGTADAVTFTVNGGGSI